MLNDLSDTDVVILCGGQGTRLRPVIADSPKALAKIGDRTFLDILIADLRNSGFNNMILCIGYLKDKIKDHFNCKRDLSIEFSEEEEPLGTGGALKKAKPLIKSDPFLVTNGDSICKIDFPAFYKFHLDKKAAISMALVPAKNAKDFGSVELDESKSISGFREKAANREGCLINAGVYLMQSEIFDFMPSQNHFSLEYDFFPRLIGNEERCFGFVVESELIDIGTPERYEKARHLME